MNSLPLNDSQNVFAFSFAKFNFEPLRLTLLCIQMGVDKYLLNFNENNKNFLNNFE